MNLDTDVVKKLLRSFEFEPLFIELGWDHLEVHPVDITVDRETHQLKPVAQKRGVQVYVCWADRIPGAVLRHKIDSRLTHNVHEHLLIFAETGKSRQVWQWVAHEAGQPHFFRSFDWRKGQAGNILTQRLAEIAIPINDEESIDLTLVIHRLKDAFDRDRVTKRFYERFAKERELFQMSISGLPDDDAKWYTSVVVNRIMFIYFLQKQGYLAGGDRDYLRGRLDFAKWKGPDHYYWDFLRPLFFEGFAKAERTAEVRQLLGDIPYLNGGLFASHVIEDKYGEKIQIPDVAFEKLLSFFDLYQWTLDDRPLGHDDEINPDVLGYIFEKYVNQKQMGAYYTKEDITGYISQETIIPRLFDMVRAKYKPAFNGARSVFALLKDDPDTYIYPSMRKGARDVDGHKIELPDKIAQGLNDVNKRGDWNRPADDKFALRTEIWREVVARTQRYQEVRRHCTNGDINDINDLITYNLDMRQFAQDALAQSDDPVFVLEFFKALTTVTVLDPTCGSGAFLFAALNILARLYEVCLQRMEQFQQDGVAYTGQALRAVQDFDRILREADKHSNRRYYILKSAVVHNLYGVDIMEEAVEICKLRLFLRLVAELKPGQPVEPLPDIDFNIKAGNTLVGYAHLQDVKTSRGEEFFGKDRLPVIEQKAEDLARLYRKLQEQQMTLGGRVTPEDKRALQKWRSLLVDELDGYLAYDYGVQTQKPNALQEWRAKTQPFQWFAEFYDIVCNGGFDVVIGNPPYVEYKDVISQYEVNGLGTVDCGNLYGPCLERAMDVMCRHGRPGMILPMSIVCADRMTSLRELVLTSLEHVWLANFDTIPSTLFVGIEQRNTIILGVKDVKNHSSASIQVTHTSKWLSEGRPWIFQVVCYFSLGSREPNAVKSLLPKVSTQVELSILTKVGAASASILEYLSPSSAGKAAIEYKRRWSYYLLFADQVERIRLPDGSCRQQQDLKSLAVGNGADRYAVVATLSSNLFYTLYSSFADFRHVNVADIGLLRIDYSGMTALLVRQLSTFGRELCRCLARSVEWRHCNYKRSFGECDAPFYRQAACVPIINEIDRVLAKYYGFTGDELDYVVNYDIKYRLGADESDEVDSV
jgi:hypothetical protein